MAAERVAEVAADQVEARVFAEGWQSWTPTTSYQLHEAQHGPANPEAWRSAYGGSRARPPAGVFQGEGLLILDPGTGDDILTVGAASGISDVPSIRAELLAPGLVGISADGDVTVTTTPARLGLEAAKAAFADTFAEGNRSSPLRPAPTTWCSWYQYHADVTAADIAENVAAIKSRSLPVDVVQIDDGYQRSVGDWKDPAPAFGPLPASVHAVRAAGLRAGIWIAPWLAASGSAVAIRHPEWLVRSPDGPPVSALHHWGQDQHVLDLTHPGAGEHVAATLAWLAGLGIDFFKLDFAFAGALDGVRRDRDRSSAEAYRAGLDLIRAAIGPDAFVLACGAPLLPSVGKVDAMRVSADTAPAWFAPEGDLSRPAGESAEVSTLGRSYQHGRYWVNDPDCLLVRPGVERRLRRIDLVQSHGGLRSSSDRVDRLDDWGVDVVRRVLGDVPPPVPFGSD